MKKLISLILTFILLASFTPHTLAADEGFGDNLLLGKSVYTPSPYPNGFGIDKINDGNENSTAATGGGSVDIRNGYQSYALIDLGELYEITRVIIKTRRDLDAGWARIGMRVSVATKSDFSDAQVVAHYVSDLGFKKDLSVAVPNTVARYVIIDNVQNGKTQSWACGEVEAYGEPYSGEGTGDFDDIDTTTQKNAVKTLYNLDIMDGISKTLFGTNNLVTRGAAAQIMCAFAGILEPIGYRDEFLDVTADHKYASYIQAGVDYGFISKDTHFRPDDYIMGYELIKMVLCINGYYDKPTHTVLYPSKLIQIANEIELLKESGTDGWGKVGRGNVAVILYNALIANKFELRNGVFEKTQETLLENIFDCQLNTGIITANGLSGLDEAKDTVNLSSVEIANKVYTDESGLGVNFLGERVYYLFDPEEDTVVTMWTDDAKNNVVTIKSEDVAPTSTMQALEEYINEEGTKKNRYKISSEAYTIKNDVADADVTSADFASENGYVKLLDNNDDEVYDVIKIYAPEIIVADTAYEDTFSQSLSIADKFGNTPLRYNYEILNITSAEGKQASVDNLPGALAYIYASADGRVVNIQIMPDAIEAVATAKSGEQIKLDGVSYDKTAYFERVYDADVEIGKSATFYTDLDGKLVAMLDVSIQGKSQVIVVIQKFIIDSGSEEYAIKVYDETGSSRDLKVGDIVVVDGEKKTLGDLAAIQNTLVGKLAYATITEDNILKVLTTEDQTLVEEPGLTVTGYCTGTAIYDNHTFKCNVNADAPIFTVPVDNITGFPLTDADYASLYSVRKMGSVFKKTSSTNTNYSVYGMNEYKSPTLLMRKVPYDTASKTFEPCNNIMNEKTACVVDTVRQNVDQYGELSYTITGYAIDSGKTVKFTTASGLEYAVNYAKLATRDDFPGPSSYGNVVTYLYNHRGVKKEGFITLENYEQYLTPFVDKVVPNPNYVPGSQNPDEKEYITIPGLKKGDIVRYCFHGGSQVAEIDLIAATEDFSGESKVIYTVGNDPIRILSTLKLQRSVVQNIKEGYILFSTGDVTESIQLSAFTGNITVIENNKIETYPMSSAGVCLEAGDKIIVTMSAWDHVSIICLKD